jgi:mono/diheme cytochrome c family protein
MFAQHIATLLLRCFATACLIMLSAGNSSADQPIDFARDVAPIFQTHCLRCHGPGKASGDFSIVSADEVFSDQWLVAGDPEASQLFTLISGDQPEMPKAGRPLSQNQVETIRRWIEQGAVWPSEIKLQQRSKADSSWWSLQPVANIPRPEGDETNPIDRFVRRKLAAQGLEPSPRADRRTLIRRLYFDLHGLPPAPQAVAEFVSDPDPAAYQKLVDRLLDSPQFGERWARHWLDIAHYADTHGFERDQRRDHAWRYRDYVIRAINEDKPYDRFLTEQICGDVCFPEESDAVIATGFLAAGPYDFVGQVETKSPLLRRSARALDLDDMVTQVMTSTMGMTVNCARCHDHKLDPITQQEYYQLVAVFAGLKRDNRVVSEQARKSYDAEQQRLAAEISRLACSIAALQGDAIDLADVVGGGNGFGSGEAGHGIDARTGKIQSRPFGALGNVQPGNFAETPYDFVDGVFVPANQQTQISSTGLQAFDLPVNGGNAWDMIRNGPVASQFSTQLGAVDYAGDGHSLLGLHANAGITFDLQAIRERMDYGRLQLSATVGYGGRTVQPSAEFRVLIDGQLVANGRLGRNDTAAIDFIVQPEQRFLTFISTDGGNGYGHDQISLGDPRLAPADVSPISDDDRVRLRQLKQELAEAKTAVAELGEPPLFFGVVAEPPPIVHLLDRGDPESPRAVVSPGRLGWGKAAQVFGPPEMSEAERRMALARWIVDPANPLTRRVIVNRLWHWHFGQGIVNTPSDFGFGGSKPSHPELLDWLAGELLDQQWSLKAIHRLIVTSETYQQSSRPRPGPAAVDADNRWLWRMNPRRIEAEAVRDAVLAVTSKLNRKMYGPGYRDFEYQEAYAPIYTYKVADQPELWRRSIYRYIVRTTPQQFLTTLDCPDPANFTPKRNISTTALQSLALFNNEFMLRQAGYFAQRLEKEVGTDAQQQIVRAFGLAFGRAPDAGEVRLGRDLIAQHGLPQFCRVLLNASEFVYID